MKWFNFKKIMVFVLVIGLLAGCSSGGNSENGTNTTNTETSSEESITIEFWAAPNPPQQQYWKEMAEAFSKENPSIHIEVSPIPESPSSEAGIQAAIAGGSAPVMSENIFRGFAAQLVDSKALVALDEMDGWDEIIQSRNMEQTIATWEFSDGHQYVLPIYSNAMLFGWRIDILKELGYDEPPQTYAEIIELGKQLKTKYPDKFLWASADLAHPDWWKRWFDFFMLYNAASEGNGFIEGNSFVADEQAGINTLQFLDELRQNDLLLTSEATDPFETGLSVFVAIGPWTFSYWEEKFPEMKLNETFVLTLPPVPDGVSTDHVRTFADTKGLVIYAQSSEEEQQAAMEFIKWVYADPQNDVKWLEITNLPSARDDLTSNDKFTSYLEEQPELQPYAAAIPNAVPPIDNANFNEIQTLIGEKAVNPLVFGNITAEDAWQEMKNAIEGVLQ